MAGVKNLAGRANPAGKPVMAYAGAWVASTVYYQGDIVKYQGALWQSPANQAASGTFVPANWVEITGPMNNVYTVTTGSYVYAASGDIIEADATSNNIIIQVPIAANSDVTVKRIDGTNNAVIIYPYPTGVVDGDATCYLVGKNAAATFIGDGTNLKIAAVVGTQTGPAAAANYYYEEILLSGTVTGGGVYNNLTPVTSYNDSAFGSCLSGGTHWVCPADGVYEFNEQIALAATLTTAGRLQFGSSAAASAGGTAYDLDERYYAVGSAVQISKSWQRRLTKGTTIFWYLYNSGSTGTVATYNCTVTIQRVPLGANNQ